MDKIITAKSLVNNRVYLFDYDYDLSDIISILNSGYYLNLGEVIKIRDEIILAHNLKAKFSFLSDLKYNLEPLKDYFLSLFSCKQIRDKIDNLVDNENNFKKTASLEYEKIMVQFELLETKINNTYKWLITKYQKYLIDKNIYLKEDKKCLLIDIQYKNSLNGNIIDLSNSGKGVFFEPEEIQKLNKELFFILANKKKEELRILKNISLVIKKDLDKFINNQEIYKALDLIFAKGIYANKYNLNKVNINTTKDIKVVNVRHPLINPDKVVPISINFASDKFIYLLTGANTGGKTVAIKTIGLCSLMLLYGLPLPMDKDSSLYLFDNVYSHIGDNQSIKNELSKFSAEIINLKNIISNATSNDLVILDEPASGTDPLEGGALACSLVNYFINHKVKVLISSHYTILKELALSSKDITYASVVFDKETLVPNYIINEGVIGESKGILTAKKYGLNNEIITQAEQIFNNSRPDSDIIMEEIRIKKEALKKEYEKLRDEELKLKKAQALFEENKEKTLAKYDEEFNLKVAKLNQENEELRKKLSDAIKNTNQAEVKKLLKTNLETKLDFDFDLNIGDSVKIIPYQKNGEVIDIKKDKYVVSFLNFKMSFTKDELRPIKKEKPVKAPKTYKKESANDFSVSLKNIIELDLRGKKYIEVADLIENYLSMLIEANLNIGRIIVGYGTGAVRKATLEYLKKSPYILKHHYADEYSGQMGAIVIYIK